MATLGILQGRLEALSACIRAQDVRSRATLISVALDITSPSQQFLSDLYDICIASAAPSDVAVPSETNDSSPISHQLKDSSSGDPSSQLRATCAAAALHYLAQQDGRVVQQFLDAFFLPLLARSGGGGGGDLPDATCRLQVCTGLVALLVTGRLWQQLRQLVAACRLALDAVAGAPPEGAKGTAAAAVGGAGTGVGAVGCSLPLRVACTLLTAIVQQLCPLAAAGGSPVAAAATAAAAASDAVDPVAAVAAAREVLRWSLSRLRSALRPLLSSASAPARQAALKALVPITLTSAQACGGSDLSATAQEVWSLALDLLGGAGDGTTAAGGGGGGAMPSTPASGVCTVYQRTALALLVSSSGLLLEPGAGVDVQGCGRFWELLRLCLMLPADVDALERKRARLLLQRLAPASQMERPGWALWAALYDILDEFPIHLVAPVWGKIDHLHAPRPEFRTETVVPKSYIPRKKELKQRKAVAAPDATALPSAADPDAADAVAASDDPAEAAEADAAAASAAPGSGGSAWSVPPSWQCVLWSRALQHGNVQVQRLGMRTLLQRDWRLPQALRGVSAGFVTGVLLPALTRDIHYRGGAAEAEVLDVQALAASWLQGWFAVAPVDDRMEGLLALRSVMAGSDLSRLGLQQLMRGVAAAARSAAADGQLLRAVIAAGDCGGGGGTGSTAAAAAVFPGAMLAALRGVLVYLVNFTGLPFKRSVWQSVLTAAAAVVPVAAAPGGCGGCLRLLLELPPATLEPGGELRAPARAWLLGRSTAGPEGDAAVTANAAPLSRAEAASVGVWLREMLEEYWGQGQQQVAATQPSAAATAAAGGGATAATIVQMLLLFDDVEAARAAVVGRLQQALYGMYGRPYLQAPESYRALVLLRELLSAVTRLAAATAAALGAERTSASAATTTTSSSPSKAPAAGASNTVALQSSLTELLVSCCEDLCSAASHAADAFLEAEPPEAAGGPDRAVIAWSCVAMALAHTCRSPHTSATRRLAATLLALLARLGRAPLPVVRRTAVVAGLRAAAAAAEALRQAAACSDAVRVMLAERLDPSALAAAALRDAAAAASAATAASAAAAAAGSDADDVSQVLADLTAAKWPLLDTVTVLASYNLVAAATPPPPLAAAANAGVRVRGAGTPAASGGLELDVVSEILSQAVAALNEYPEGQVLPLLRCLRRCWVAVARGEPELQAAAARALGAEPPPQPQNCPGAAPAGSLLEALCWPVVRALWNALCATPRRTGPLCAAFVNTALLPCLYVQQSGPSLRSLHGPSGPCRWLLSRLLEWGGTSPRFLLLLACQLGSFLPLQPHLVECYCREIQTLLLWGSRKGSTYDSEGPSAADGAEAEELAAVAGPIEPSLVAGPAIGTEVAPRVALLCAIHQLAQDAGCVWPPPAAAPAPAAAAVAVPPPPVNRRPVIVFGDASDWDEEAAAPAAASTTATSTSTAAAKDMPADDPATQDFGAPPPLDPAHPSLLAGQLLWRQLLAVGLDDPLLSGDKVRNGSELHRQKVRLWQSLVVLSSFVPRGECGPAVAAMLGQVNGNNPPTVKQYVEAAVAALVLREPSLLHTQLLPLLSSYSRHATGLGSHILIAAQVLLHSPPALQRARLRPLLLALSPWLMCHGHNVRTYAQLVTWALLQRFPPEDPLWAHSIGDLSYLHQMLSFMRSNVDLVRLRRNIGDPILEWSPAGLAHPARVFAASPDGVCLAGSPIEQSTFEGAPTTLVDRIQTFLVSERHRLRDELSDRAAEREFAPQDPTSTAAVAGGSTAANTASAAGTAAAAGGGGGGGGGGGIGDFQRKIKPEALMATLTLQGPAAAGPGGLAAAGFDGAAGRGGGGDGEAAGDLAALLAEEEAEAEAAEQDWKSSSSASRRLLRHDVLLVASLIDKLPNLAGLARSCEVLGAGRLVLGDLAATRDPLFTSVSVTAEQWLPMEEVKPAALLAWLERRAAEGYTLVGLEQTAESVRLPDYVWPERVVLVLGREKEGIPPEVLSLLDATLEIPQRGIIRSLNVHVSGAIALYEYVRQMKAPAAAGPAAMLSRS